MFGCSSHTLLLQRVSWKPKICASKVTLLTFRSGNFAVAGKVDTYKKNLVQQRDENKKKKSQHSSAYSVAVAKAGFNRRKKKVNRKILFYYS